MSFADFPAQRQVVDLLQRSLRLGRLAHAYLFTGYQLGVLEEMARTLAKVINCDAPPTRDGADTATRLDSCDHCAPCAKIDASAHPDVLWVRPESKLRIITIDQMREAMRTMHLKPHEARYKVAVIVAADRLNTQAANAFLKTLEEPPDQTIIILLSTEPQRVLETILSRCLRLHFAGESKYQLAGAQGALIAEFSQTAAAEQKGLLGRYRSLGKLLARLAELKAEIEKSLTDRSPQSRYEDVDPKLREKWDDELSAAVEAEYRRQRADLLLGLQWWLRDVWLHALGVGRAMASFPELSVAAEKVARRITPKDAAANLEAIEQTQRLLRTNVQEALTLEVGLLKLKL